jgi:hypothetical protein
MRLCPGRLSGRRPRSPIPALVDSSDLALVRGLADARATLAAWNERPWPVMFRWLAGALAAWIIASRRRDWHELLGATAVTVMLAVPALVAAAFVEVYVSPGVLRSLAG